MTVAAALGNDDDDDDDDGDVKMAVPEATPQ